MNPVAAYGIAIIISLLFSIAELFTKFRDEPFLILGKAATWLYAVINIAVTAGFMYLLTQTTVVGEQITDLLTASLIAGFGSAVLLRSKFLKVNVGGKEVAIGPEVFVNIFLETLERQIDRERALVRKTLVEEHMADIDFNKAKTYVTSTIIAGSQLESNRTQEIQDEIKKIDEVNFSNREKSYALGYLILDLMGEKYLKAFFNNKNSQEYKVTAID
jgi:hypothetical protein